MARFEKVHARRKHFCVLGLEGNTLSQHAWEGKEQDKTDRLVGFKLFPDAADARKALELAVTDYLNQGYEPMDSEAKELASTLDLKPAKPEQYQLPFRLDLSVYNEANGFTVHTKKLLGAGLDDGSSKWEKAVKDGCLIPVALTQDDPFIIRICAGGPLTEQESQEWVGKIETKLKLPDGQLCVGGGAEHIYGGDDDVEISSHMIHFVSMPAGTYKATVYMYIPGINGWSCIEEVEGGSSKAEPPGKWFRRSHPGKEFPMWLRSWCIGDRESDPGHEKEWEGLPYIDDDDLPEYVGFLLHLEVDEAPKAKGPTTRLECGWFNEVSRKPELCPLGIEAVSPKRNEGVRCTNWIYPTEVSPLVQHLPLTPIQGGSVAIALDKVSHVFRVANFCSGFAMPELRLTLPSGQSLTVGMDWPEQVVPLAGKENVRFLFGADNGPDGFIVGLESIPARLHGLPEGTIVELDTVGDHRDARQPAPAWQRYRGTLAGGQWHIEESFPALTKQQLQGALEIARQVQEGADISVKEQADGADIHKYAMSAYGFQLEDNLPVLDGAVIKLQTPDKHLLRHLGASAFFVRFKDVWSCTDFSDDDDDDDDDEDDDDDF